MKTPKTQTNNPKRRRRFAEVTGYAALIRRKGWHNWQQAVTVIRDTANGWRIRWETGFKSGKCATVTRRNWEIEAKPHNDQAEASGARGRPIANPDAPAALPPARG